MEDHAVSVPDSAEAAPEVKRSPGRPKKPETIDFYVDADGFTMGGTVWTRGQEVSYVVGSSEYKDTLDREGKSWLDLVSDESAQIDRWGKVMIRPGAWPGKPFEDEAALAAEIKRGKSVPKLPTKV